MNQGLTYELLEVMPQTVQTGLLSATCTIQQRTNAVSATGQPDLTDWINITGLINIPCMFAIQRPALPNQQATIRMPQQFATETQYHVLLNGYYPQILQQNQAVVTIDGQTAQPLEIMGVESDSQATQTRLALRVWTQ